MSQQLIDYVQEKYNVEVIVIKGNVYDITDAVKDITDESWEATPETKKEKTRCLCFFLL